MENLLYLIASSLMQKLSAPAKFKSYQIGNTGCTALFLSQNSPFEKIKSKTGDDLYFGEFKDKNVTYGIICVSLIETYTLEEAEALLDNYINKLKKPFYILHSTGVNTCTNWNNQDTSCLIDYWQDVEKMDWKIKGYTDGKVLSILYVKNICQGDVRKQDIYLDSFHFKTPTLI